jgi:hypothetical protein
MRKTKVLVERFVTLDGSFIGTATTRVRSTLYHRGYARTGRNMFASKGAHMCRYGRSSCGVACAPGAIEGQTRSGTLDLEESCV